MTIGTTYDYIIVGAGTAGSLLANRLTENPDVSVLLVEAGPDDRNWVLQMPAGLRSVFKPSSKYNWWFKTTPQKHLDGREIDQPRGKALGGSSSINGMTFLRGNPRDYDDWAHVHGCDGWTYADCLPYFKRFESFNDADGTYRSAAGEVGVTRQEDLSPLNAAFLEAGQQAGYPLLEDVNGYRQEGVSRFDMSVKDGYRSSSARAFLHNNKPGQGLTITRQARVRRIVTEGRRATGVEVLIDGRKQVLQATREVILCAGAFGTPQLMMLSGIGPAAHLQQHSIDVVLDAPGVGENLQDHLEAHIQVETDAPVSLNRELKLHRMLWAGIQWFGFKTGVAAVNQCHVGAFLRTDEHVTHPNIQFHFFPVFFGENWIPNPALNGYRLGAGPMRPESRGTVRLTSANPDDAPLIDPNYLASERDRHEMREGLKLGREVLAQDAFKPFHKRENIPGPTVQSDAELDAFIRQDASSAYHPCGTCKMGPDTDADAVVDTQLRVKGIDNLRIVDASVIPAIPSANINAAVFMIADKASDIIRNRPSLPAEPVTYYRATTQDNKNRNIA